jgi:hypothetical protein
MVAKWPFTPCVAQGAPTTSSSIWNGSCPLQHVPDDATTTPPLAVAARSLAGTSGRNSAAGAVAGSATPITTTPATESVEPSSSVTVRDTG